MSDIASIPVAQMREAAQAWRKHGLSMSAHDRIDDFIAEIERLRTALCQIADRSKTLEEGWPMEDMIAIARGALGTSNEHVATSGDRSNK